MNHKDLFSTTAASYAEYRPRYPDDLYAYIFSKCHELKKAWDVGTGNGQVAQVLAENFDQVYASDISTQQLNYATKKHNIQYVCEAAENCSAPDNSFDLITVAQAVHWFHFESFYSKVRQVLKPDGILAVWVYDIVHIETKIDQLIHQLYSDTLGPYWDPERYYIDQQLKTIPFTFQELSCPEFIMEANWSREQLLGYISTWSAWQHYNRVHQKETDKTNERSPLDLLREEIYALWEEGTPKRVWFPVYLRMGRMHN